MANYISSNTGAVIDAAVDKVENSNVSEADLTKLAAITSTASEIKLTDLQLLLLN
tara:strand:+ start:7476 stop:7640 length:165 start_codon:yes stop_codon:yes gene_type:complete